MANNIYIGMRYVPIYVGDYDSETVYEPLSIVAYNGASYTSKQSVPAGILPTNTTYWAKSSDFNAQYSELSDRIDELDEIVDGIHSDMRDKKVIIIGDSYAAGYTPETGDVAANGWAAKLVPMLGLQSGNYKISAVGGTGFSSATTSGGFISQLNAIYNEDTTFIPDIIVVCGGRNDDTQSAASIISGCTAFATRAKTIYPNAHIFVGMIGWDANYTTQLNMSKVLEAYIKGCAEGGMTYLSNVEFTLHNRSLLSAADGKHPNATGNLYLAEQIASAMLSGGADVEYFNFYVDVTPASGIQLANGFALQCNVSNTLTKVGSVNPSIKFNTPRTVTCNGGRITFGTCPDAPTLGQRDINQMVPMPFVITSSGSPRFTECTGCIEMHGGSLSVRLLGINAEGTNYKSIANVTQIDTYQTWTSMMSSMP